MLRNPLPSILLLALFVPPLAALEESLVGTWEASDEVDDAGSITTRLIFLEDGTFELSSVWRTADGYLRPPQLVFEEDDDFTAADAEALNQLFRDAWPETPLDTSSFLGSGTYATSGDSLRLEWVALDITYDDKDFSEFLVPFWTQFGLNWETEVRAAQDLEFPEEDRLALEQELTTLYHLMLTTEALLAGLQEPSSTTYDIRDEGKVLVLEGPPFHDPLLFQEAEPRARPQAKPLAYRRIDVASAVTPATWGGVTATLSP